MLNAEHSLSSINDHSLYIGTRSSTDVDASQWSNVLIIPVHPVRNTSTIPEAAAADSHSTILITVEIMYQVTDGRRVVLCQHVET